MPGRIFISYSKAEPKPTRELADFLTSQGYTVWWDTNLTSGEVFREVIDRELAAADAVIVIWSAHSVASNWVVSEADDAARRNKLITVRTKDLEPWRIPKPYNTYQADPVDNRDAVLAAVRRVAGEPPKPEVKPAPSLSEATVREALAIEHWQAIKTSADPAKFRTYLAEFGDTKCAGLARAEFERLAEREWRKVANSKNEHILRSFCLLFSGVPQAQLAYACIAALSPNKDSASLQSSTTTQNGIPAFLHRNASAVALIWLFTIVPLAIASPFIFMHLNLKFFTFDAGAAFSGCCGGLFLVLLTASILLLRTRLSSWPIFVLIYWLGITLAVAAFVWAAWSIFSGPQLVGGRYEPGITGFTAGMLLIACSGVAAFYWWKAHRNREPKQF